MRQFDIPLEDFQNPERAAKVIRVLINLGIPSNLVGFVYLTHIVYYDETYRKEKLGTTYVKVSDLFGSSVKSVERTIRWSIKHSNVPDVRDSTVSQVLSKCYYLVDCES